MLTKDKIIPIPQSFHNLDGKPVLLGFPGKANYTVKSFIDESDPQCAHAVDLLRRKLTALLNDGPCDSSDAAIISLKNHKSSRRDE